MKGTRVISEAMAITFAGGAERELDFAALVELEQAALLRVATRLLRDPDEARDLVQTAFADAFEHRDAMRDPSAAGAWLRRIVVRRALNHLRRRRVWRRVRELLGARDTPEPVAPAPPPDALVARARRLEAVARALEALPARQQAAFTLRYLEGLDLDEIAVAMDVGRGTVKTHLHRALEAMRGSLGEGEP